MVSMTPADGVPTSAMRAGVMRQPTGAACAAAVSPQSSVATNLTALPTTWTAGSTYANSAFSAYAVDLP